MFYYYQRCGHTRVRPRVQYDDISLQTGAREKYLLLSMGLNLEH
jgi:hypothetical protein